MLNKSDENISIATKLIKIVFSIYFVFALVITLTQIITEFNDEKEKVLNEINSLVNTLGPIMAEALWEEDSSQLRAGVRGLIVNPNILAVVIKDDDGVSVDFKNEFGNPENFNQPDSISTWGENRILIKFNLNHISEDNEEFVGSGIIYTKNRKVLRRVKLTLILTVVNAILKTLILWGIIYFTVQKIVTKPLQELTKKLLSLNPKINSENDRSIIEKKFNSLYGKNEISIVMENFEDMKNEINSKGFALEQESRRLMTLISNLPGVVYRCANTEKRTMEFLSERCGDLTGYEIQDLLDDNKINYNEIINRADRNQIYNKILDSIISDQPYSLEYRITTKDQNEKWVSEQGRGIIGENGEIEALEGFIIDITLQKEAHYTLKNYNENLEKEIKLRGKEVSNTNQELSEINNQMNDFVAIVAHDLRNPIGNIISLSEIAKDTEAKDKNEIISSIERIAKSSLELVMDILDIAALKGGSIQLEFRSWNFADLAEDILDMVQFMADKKDIKVVNNAKTNFVVEADYKRISQVISNLLSNAIKFTPRSGTISLKTSIDKGLLLIEVIDSGIGIDPDEIENLFSKTVKTTSIGTDGEQGTGYGLPLCQDLIFAHKSKIMVKNNDDIGSKFYFYLKS